MTLIGVSVVQAVQPVSVLARRQPRSPAMRHTQHSDETYMHSDFLARRQAFFLGQHCELTCAVNFRSLTFYHGNQAIHRGGAVYIEGAENVTVRSCFFDQVGGNGVVVSRYARDVVVQDNEMHRIGDSGVLVVGDLKYDTATPWEHLDGNYPVRTTVKGNLIHELGIFTKQVAGYFQALAANSSVTDNIILNGWWGKKEGEDTNIYIYT